MILTIERLRARDPAAMEALVREHHAAVYRLALSILGDTAEADDAAQECFLRAWDGLEAYRGEAAVSTWLYAITVNVCRGRLKKRRSGLRLQERLRAFFQTGVERPLLPEELTLQSERDERLWQAVQDLREKHRLPVILHYYHDLPVAEIARVLKVPEGTVLSRLYWARKKLLAEYLRTGSSG